jgi:hypothetical protein
MDFIAMAETLEAQAASLRRHAAELAAEGQGALELEAPVVGEWRDWEGGEQPPESFGKVVDVQLRDGYEMRGPASALEWLPGAGPSKTAVRRDIIAWRISAEQPDE